MKICIPAASSGGITAPMSGHFGRAPYFALVDNESKNVEFLANPEAGHGHEHGHEHGQGHGLGHGHQHGQGHDHCGAAQRIVRAHPEVVLTSGIGRGAFEVLHGAGIHVYRVTPGSIEAAMAAHATGRSVEVDSSSLGCG